MLDHVRYLDGDIAKKISKIGLGTGQFGSQEWGYGDLYAERTAHAIVRRAHELGVTLFDTAEIYGFGRSERILGRALGDDRGAVFLATKMFPVVPSALAVRHRAAASANRLGTPRLDLYQVHWSNPPVRDRPIMRGMRSLQLAGQVGEVGVSSYSLKRWRTAEDALGSRIFSNQVLYSLVDRSPERDLLPFAMSQRRVIIAFRPLTQGLLSGNYHGASRPLNPARATSPLFHPENLQRTSGLIATLREVADAHSATPAQIALAWVIHHPVVAAIPGASSVEQLESNVAAAEIKLADDEYQALDRASAQFCPDAVVNASSRRNLGTMRHAARGGWYVTKTVWQDHKQARIPLSNARTERHRQTSRSLGHSLTVVAPKVDASKRREHVIRTNRARLAPG
jgi:aryl-alcohol dehydrogenase-like predicted oxidoreductase